MTSDGKRPDIVLRDMIYKSNDLNLICAYNNYVEWFEDEVKKTRHEIKKLHDKLSEVSQQK